MPSSFYRRLPVRHALLAALACTVSSACARKGPGGAEADAAGPIVSSAPDAGIAPTASLPDASLSFVRVSPVEARRTRMTTLSGEPALVRAAGLLEKQYEGARAAAFDVQSAPLTARGRTAFLVSEADKPPNDARPFALVAEEDGRIVWSKEHPIAGILPPVGPSAIAAAPRGRVAIAVCDPPTTSIALRLWDDDGAPFADFQALTGIESCDALSLLHWPAHGWLIVAARPGSTRGRLLSETGAPAWHQTLDLGVRSKEGPVAAPSVAADTDDSFVLVQVTQPSGEPGSPFHALAFRYDARGASIWKAAVDLGEVPGPNGAGRPKIAERVTLSPTDPGVRVRLPSGKEVDLRPSGDVIRRGALAR